MIGEDLEFVGLCSGNGPFDHYAVDGDLAIRTLCLLRRNWSASLSSSGSRP
jgi:hypothetical protein